MLLSFDERHLLPEGIHDASLNEIEQALALSNRRRTLFGNLKQYVASVKLTDWACQILADGKLRDAVRRRTERHRHHLGAAC